jgi:hypothetical protein
MLLTGNNQSTLRKTCFGFTIATCYGLDGPGIESRCGRDFPLPSRPALGPPSLLYNGYRVFSGGKAAGAWHWPSTPYSAEVKERVEFYLYSPTGPSLPVLGWTLHLPLRSGNKPGPRQWQADGRPQDRFNRECPKSTGCCVSFLVFGREHHVRYVQKFHSDISNYGAFLPYMHFMLPIANMSCPFHPPHLTDQ